MDFNSSEKTYLVELLNLRLLDIQKNSFLFTGERVFIDQLVSKLGFRLEFSNGYFLIPFSPKSINFDK